MISVVGGARGVPDVAWDAAVNGGVLVYYSYFPQIEGPPAWGVFGGTSSSSPQVAALTAIGNQARATAGKGPIGNLNAVIYSHSFNRSVAFSDVVPHTYGSTRAASCRTTGSGTPTPAGSSPLTPFLATRRRADTT